MERDIPEFTKYTIVLFALNESCRIQLGQSRPMAGKAQTGSSGQNTFLGRSQRENEKP